MSINTFANLSFVQLIQTGEQNYSYNKFTLRTLIFAGVLIGYYYGVDPSALPAGI